MQVRASVDESLRVRSDGTGVYLFAAVTVVRLDVPKTASERTRQHAMWNLVEVMRSRDVHDLIFEARERSQNKKDERTLHSISRARISADVFRYAFARPLEEPLLWLADELADELAAAIGEQLRDGGNGRFLESLPDELLDRPELPPLPR